MYTNLIGRPAFSGLGDSKLLGGKYTITPTTGKDPSGRPSSCLDTSTGKYVPAIICQGYTGVKPTSSGLSWGEGLKAGVSQFLQTLLPQQPGAGMQVAPMAPARPNYVIPLVIGAGVVAAVLLLKKK